jgi:hypothetical protein
MSITHDAADSTVHEEIRASAVPARMRWMPFLVMRPPLPRNPLELEAVFVSTHLWCVTETIRFTRRLGISAIDGALRR